MCVKHARRALHVLRTIISHGHPHYIIVKHNLHAIITPWWLWWGSGAIVSWYIAGYIKLCLHLKEHILGIFCSKNKQVKRASDKIRGNVLELIACQWVCGIVWVTCCHFGHMNTSLFFQMLISSDICENNVSRQIYNRIENVRTQ